MNEKFESVFLAVVLGSVVAFIWLIIVFAVTHWAELPAMLGSS